MPPEPENPSSNEPTEPDVNVNVIEVSSDESDNNSDGAVEEASENGQYVLLGQAPANVDSDSDDDGDEFQQYSQYEQLTDETEEVSLAGTMTENQAEAIKAVMSKIKLPSIPTWAKHIPEQQWMNSLLQNVQKRKEKTTSTSQNQQQQQTDSNTAFDFADFESNFPSERLE